MSLRLRLALSLAVLLAVGMAVFGVATYSFYAPSQYAQLDTQLKSSVSAVSFELEQLAHVTTATGQGGSSYPPGNHDQSSPEGPPPAQVLAPGSYAALLSPSGKIVKTLDVFSNAGVPRLPANLGPHHGASPQIFTADSVKSGPEWRVLVSGAVGAVGYRVVIAEPTTSVADNLHRLLLVEAEVAVGLLVLLLVGAWLILRRGLSPLEDMAHTSRAIAAGDLSRRVGPSKGPTEVLELGAALNAMLADIENAFAERDVTEARLRQFLADVSHELRTPLTSIQGFAELFRLSTQDGRVPRGTAGGAHGEAIDHSTVARRIEDETERMKRLVNDLLLLARLDQEPQAQRDEVDLAVVAADACSAAVASEPGRPIELDAPSPVGVVGDRDHLQRAIDNLLSNALKHTPAGSSIEVSVTPSDSEAVVRVRDHGTGLDEEALAHAFDRFWQADQARAGTGAGLGLSIVAAIAAEHGGSISGANVEGGGAEFSLRLPLSGETAGDETGAGNTAALRRNL